MIGAVRAEASNPARRWLASQSTKRKSSGQVRGVSPYLPPHLSRCFPFVGRRWEKVWHTPRHRMREGVRQARSQPTQQASKHANPQRGSLDKQPVNGQLAGQPAARPAARPAIRGGASPGNQAMKPTARKRHSLSLSPSLSRSLRCFECIGRAEGGEAHRHRIRAEGDKQEGKQ